MKRFFSLWFAFLILLSSGVTQGLLHQCPEKGLQLSEASCGMHEKKSGTPDCCRTITHKAVDLCCSDSYFFTLSAKFGSVHKFQLNVPAAFPLPGFCPGLEAYREPEPVQMYRNSIAGVSPPGGRLAHTLFCSFII
ncbi:MAG: hypothetical protein JNL57_08750 [Bacteroidetes bacterium]|nr:hypothetical protein [Bacteroidota bacterium]